MITTTISYIKTMYTSIFNQLLWICTTIWYFPLSFSWVSSTFTSTAATLAWFSSVCLPLHAACQPNTTECLWHCHLDVMSYFSPVTQRRRLSTGSSSSCSSLKLNPVVTCRVPSKWLQDLIFYNTLYQIRTIGTARGNITDSHHRCVSGWDGKPAAEPGWDSPGGDLWVPSAPLREWDPVQKGKLLLFAPLNSSNLHVINTL